MHAYFIHDATDPAPKVREHTSDPDQFVIEFGGDISGYIHRDNLLALCASALHVLGESAIYPQDPTPDVESMQFVPNIEVVRDGPEDIRPGEAPVEDLCDHCGHAVRQATADDEFVPEGLWGFWIHRDTGLFSCSSGYGQATVDGDDRPKTEVPS